MAPRPWQEDAMQLVHRIGVAVATVLRPPAADYNQRQGGGAMPAEAVEGQPRAKPS